MSERGSRGVTDSKPADAAPDRDLLTRFVRQSDESAFAEIVRRHSGLVWGVCTRVLRDRHAAEDAFQATFLVLAQSAHTIRKRRSLASWLHGVAHRTSLRLLAQRERRREQATPMETIIEPAELNSVEQRYEQQLLDAELQRLPDKYREPLVLHYLEGLSQQQVADRLGMSIPAVDGRLKRGRKELKLRMMRRGVQLGAILAAVQASQSAAAAASLEPLVALTTQTALSATSGSAPANAASPEIGSLAGKELSTMALSTKLVSTVGATAILVTLIGLGAASTAPGSDAGGGVTDVATEFDAVAPATAEEGTLNLAQNNDAAAPDDEASSDLTKRLETIATELDDLARSVDRNAAAVLESRDNAQEALDELRKQIERLRQQLEEQSPPASGDAPMSAMSGDDASDGGGPSKAPAPPRSMDEFINMALDSKTTLEFPGNPLRDVLEYVSIIHNFPIIIDAEALSEVGVTPDEEIHLVLSDIELGNALEIMFRNVAGVELDYVVQNEVMTVTTREKADTMLETRVYDLKSLADVADAEQLAQVIQNTIHQASWRTPDALRVLPGGVGPGPGMGGQPVGNEGGEGSIEALNDVLIVTQSQRVHRKIEELLTQLRRDYGSPPPDTAEVRHIREQLQQPTQLEAVDMPFDRVMRELAQRHTINIVIDGIALQRAGATTHTPINIVLSDVRLGAALDLILEQVADDQLGYVVEDEFLKITTSDDTSGPDRRSGAIPTNASTYLTRIYAVPDILWPNGEEIPADAAERARLSFKGFDALVKLVQQIDPETWDDEGGDLATHPGTFSLVVRQTPRVHDRITDVLAIVRQLVHDNRAVEEVEVLNPDGRETESKLN